MSKCMLGQGCPSVFRNFAQAWAPEARMLSNIEINQSFIWVGKENYWETVLFAFPPHLKVPGSVSVEVDSCGPLAAYCLV